MIKMVNRELLFKFLLRYACLVAEPESEIGEEEYNFVGVVDVTVAGDLKIKRLLPPGVKEYLFVTGIAVAQNARSI